MKKSVAAVAIIFLSGCEIFNPKPGPISSVEEEGFEPFPSARSFHGPGTIYRVDENGTVFEVSKINGNPQRGREEIGRIQKKAVLSLGQVLEIVGAQTAIFSASEKLALGSTREFITESVSGTRQSFSDEQIEGRVQSALTGISIRPNNKYYLIRETILSDNITFSTNISRNADLALGGKLEQAVSGSANLQWVNSQNVTLSKNFGEPLNIWYKPERIEILRPAASVSPDVFSVSIDQEDNEFSIPPSVTVAP